MYGFIDVVDYQKVVVTDSSKGIIKAKDNYLKETKKEAQDEELKKEEIEIVKISDTVINGNTYYYIESKDNRFKAPINLSDKLPFLVVGDKLTIGYYESDNEVIEIEKIYKEAK
jgi:hypothetical protein